VIEGRGVHLTQASGVVTMWRVVTRCFIVVIYKMFQPCLGRGPAETPVSV